MCACLHVSNLIMYVYRVVQIINMCVYMQGIWYYGSDVAMMFIGLYVWHTRTTPNHSTLQFIYKLCFFNAFFNYSLNAGHNVGMKQKN